MSIETQGRRFLAWLIQRNPTYLISACLIAAGARLFLVGSADPAGDMQLILVTLIVLQFYEWSVGGILLALHRANRAPEDQPSLLLILAAFWTGPMAATAEMIALRPQLGLILAIGACLIAIGELKLCCRTLHLRLSAAGQIVASACVGLLAVTAPLLKTPARNSGENEFYLYVAWWIFAAIVLCCLGAIRSHREHSGKHAASPHQTTPPAWEPEAFFLAMTIIAAAVHLIGMNYGFFCHAAPFYASPLLLAICLLGLEAVSPQQQHRRVLLASLGALPLLSIYLAHFPFEPEFPLHRLPEWIRNPMIPIATLAGMVCWLGYWRHRWTVLLHAGTAALALAAVRFMQFNEPLAVVAGRATIINLFFGTAAYFTIIACVIRVRADALIALFANGTASILLVWGRTPADHLMTCLVVGWTTLIGLHLLAFRTRLIWRLLPIAVLAVFPWLLNDNAAFHRLIAIHTLIMALALFVVGRIWPWTRYRTVSALLVGGYLFAAASQWTADSAHPEAAMLVFAGFGSLAMGMLISWKKRGWLGKLSPGVTNAEVESTDPAT